MRNSLRSRLQVSAFYYDEGIHPGNTWHDDLAKALDRCSLFVFFVTARSVVSRNCERELAFALDADKPVLPVFLEDTEVPPGVRLAIGNRQAIIRSRFDEQSYRDRLVAAIREYVGDSAEALAVPSVPSSIPPSAKPAKRSWLPLAITALAVVLVAGYALIAHVRSLEEAQAAHARTVSEIATLVAQDRYTDAFTLARPLVIADADGTDAELRTLWKQIIAPGMPIVADAGAKLSFKPYDDFGGAWIEAGTTPFDHPLDLPRGVLRVKLEKEGFDTGEFTIANPGPSLKATDKDNLRNIFAVPDAPLQLTGRGTLPDDMVFVPHTNLPIMMIGLTQGMSNLQQHDVPAFAIARREVTQRTVQRLHRGRRLRQPCVLGRTRLRGRRPQAVVGRGARTLRRSNGSSRPFRLATQRVSRRSVRDAGRRHQLVRGGGVFPVPRSLAADPPPLDARVVRAVRPRFSNRTEDCRRQSLPRGRADPRRQRSGHRTVGHAEHGRQRSRMGVEPRGRQGGGIGRRMDRLRIDVSGLLHDPADGPFAGTGDPPHARPRTDSRRIAHSHRRADRRGVHASQARV